MQTPQIERLPSGLSLVVNPVQTAPVVAFQVWVHAGGFDELPNERGLAHLHEHMLFKGTPTRAVGQIAAEIEAAGGQINAWTSHDQTCYHVVMPASAWREGLDVLADAMCHSLFDAEELGREKEVVVEEINRAEDSPGRVAYRRLFEMIFDDHPYALPVLGTIQSVRDHDRNTMRGFYDKHYVAKNTTIIASGAFDPDEVRGAVASCFADLGTQAPPERRKAQQQAVSAGASVLESSFSESRLIYAFPAPQLHHTDVPSLDVLAIALGQGESSRLFRHVRRDLQLANDIGTSCYTPQRGGLFSVGMLTSEDRLADAYRESLRVVDDVLDRGITKDELEKARNIILAEATYKLETVQGQAHSLGYYSVACEDPSWEKRYHEKVASVTREQVLDAARKWLDPSQVQIVQMLGKAEEGGRGATLDEATLLEMAQGARRTPSTPLAIRQADVVDRIEKIELPSGDTLLVLPDHHVPVMSLRVATLGGLRDETAANNGVSNLVSDLVTRGSAFRNGDAFAHAIDTLAADVSGFSGRNSIGLTAVSMSHNREAVLELFGESLFWAELPDHELEVARAAQLQDIRHRSDAPARTAFLAMLDKLYGTHPYGLDSLGTEASVAAMKRDDLLAYLRGRLAPGNLVFAAAGDVDAQWLADALIEMSPTDRTALPQPSPSAIPELTERIELREAADKTQAHVCLGFAGTTLKSDDRFALQVLSTLLSGQGGRLFLQLRDKQSLAYSVSSMTVEGVDPGYFAFYIGTSPDKVQTALTGLYAEIDKLVQAPVGQDELDRARRYLSGAHAIGLQRSGARAATIGFNHLYGLGRDAYRGHLEQLQKVTVEDILAVARKYLNVERHVQCVLAPDE